MNLHISKSLGVSYRVFFRLFKLLLCYFFHIAWIEVISVYPLFFVGTLGTVEHGNQYQIKLMYEHHLQRTACNMTYGPFGGVKGRLVVAYSLLLVF